MRQVPVSQVFIVGDTSAIEVPQMKKKEDDGEEEEEVEEEEEGRG